MCPFFAFSLRLVACGLSLFFQPAFGGHANQANHPATSRHILRHPACERFFYLIQSIEALPEWKGDLRIPKLEYCLKKISANPYKYQANIL
jgi:hypothetical protein